MTLNGVELTPRNQEVLDLMLQGMNNEEIAAVADYIAGLR